MADRGPDVDWDAVPSRPPFWSRFFTLATAAAVIIAERRAGGSHKDNARQTAGDKAALDGEWELLELMFQVSQRVISCWDEGRS